VNVIESISRELADHVAKVQGGVVRVQAGCRGGGTGLAWSERLVVTAAHNLSREEGIEIATGAGRRPATLLGIDGASDVAVLRVDEDLAPFPKADVDALRVGELVVALARPHEHVRASLGVLSVVGSEYRLPGGARVDRYLESDVRLTNGFSGGPLLSARGELIGMNTAGLVRSAALTLPSPTLARIVEALVAHGRVQRAYLGVSVHGVRLARRANAEWRQRLGLVVLGVQPDGPADAAGVLQGDILLRLANKPLERVSDLEAALDAETVGKAFDLEVLRGGEPRTLSVTPRLRA